MRKLLFALALALATTTTAEQARPAGTLQGVWRVTERTTTGPNGAVDRNPQPGLYIFTAKHYSLMFVSAANRPDIQGAAIDTATADQLRQMWAPFTANSGTYEVSGSTLTMRPLVAKNPNAMASGNFNTNSFKIEGNTLTLTQVGGQRGPAPNPTTTKLTRVE